MSIVNELKNHFRKGYSEITEILSVLAQNTPSHCQFYMVYDIRHDNFKDMFGYFKSYVTEWLIMEFDESHDYSSYRFIDLKNIDYMRESIIKDRTQPDLKEGPELVTWIKNVKCLGYTHIKIMINNGD